MITIDNIARHEFIGLSCSVTNHLKMTGEVIDETMKTITLDVSGKRKMVQKKGNHFIFKLPGDGRVSVDGDKIVSRPEDRIKKKIKKW